MVHSIPASCLATVLILGAAASAVADPAAAFAPLPAEPPAGLLSQFKSDALALVDPGGVLGSRGVGSDRWLFYAEELRLNARTVANYLEAVPAIVSLHEQLKSVGVELVYMPIPPKWAIYPDAVSNAVKPDAHGRIPRLIPESESLFAALRAKGVTVVDLSAPFVQERHGPHGPVHLRYDTHWSPAGMAVAGRVVAETLRERPWCRGLPRLSGLTADWRPVELPNGDIRQGLAALGDQDPVKDWPQAEGPVQARIVSGRVDRDEAPVVVVGDSNLAAFSAEFNVAAQLAYELKLPVDQIGIPVDGCVRELGRKAYKDPTYLLSKKAVVWLHTGRGMGGPQLDLPVVADKHRRLLGGAIRAGLLREETLVLRRKPAALWPLDDPWGVVARDLSGGGRDGLYEQGVELSHAGGRVPAADAPPELRAARFAGGRMFADLPAGNLPDGKDFSLAVWVWREEAAGEAGLWGMGSADGAGKGDRLVMTSAGTLALSTAGDSKLAGKTAIPAASWHHVAVVREGDRVTCYLDGTEEFRGAAAAAGAPTPRLFLGGTTNADLPWRGRLCGAVFHARALPADEIVAEFADWFPVATPREDLAVATDPAAGRDTLVLRADDVDATPPVATPLTRITARGVGKGGTHGETLPLEKLAPGVVDLELQINFRPLAGRTRASTPFAVRVVPAAASVDTDVAWTGRAILPSGLTAAEWWRGGNWKDGRPPASQTGATVVFEDEATPGSRLDEDRRVGSLLARGRAGGQTIDLGGKTLAVAGDVAVDLAAAATGPFTIASGTLRIGAAGSPGRVRVVNGGLRLDANLDTESVESVAVPDDGGREAVLMIGGEGTFAARRLSIAAGAGADAAVGGLLIPPESRLKKIMVADSLRIAAGDAAGERTSVRNGFDAGGGDWALADGIDITIGSPDRPAAELLIGQGKGESKRGSLVAGVGGAFSAHVRQIQVGAMSGSGSGWGGPAAAEAVATAEDHPKPAAAAPPAESIDPAARTIEVQARRLRLDARAVRVAVDAAGVSGSLAAGPGVLVVDGPKVFEAGVFEVAAPGRGTLAVHPGGPLRKLVVRDRFRLAVGDWSTALENGYDAGGGSWIAGRPWGQREAVVGRGVGLANWMLPDGIDYEIGSAENPASEFTLGLGSGWSARGCLVAGAGGVCTAHVALLQVGCMAGGGSGWYGAMQPEVRRPQVVPPFGVGNDHWGILDLAGMERCEITAAEIKVGHAVASAPGAQLIGRLALPPGTVRSRTVAVGHDFPVSTALFIGDAEWNSEESFRIGTEGRLELAGTTVHVDESFAIHGTGTVDVIVSETSAGPELAANAKLAITGRGRLNIVFRSPPRTAGVHCGFRQEGDHRDELAALIAAGRITLDAAALGADAGDAGVFTIEDRAADGATRVVTCIGFRNAADGGGNAFAGVLDLSRMGRCEIAADAVEVGHSTVESWGTKLAGRLVLPRGTVRVRTAAVGHAFPVSDRPGTAAFRAGGAAFVGLNGTVFRVAERLDVLPTGVVETRVSTTSCGIDLAAKATCGVAAKGGLTIVFESLPEVAGLFYGLRWEGDRKADLERLIGSGMIVVDDGAVRREAGPAGVFVGDEGGRLFSYVGYPRAPRGTVPPRGKEAPRPEVAGSAAAAVKPAVKPAPRPAEAPGGGRLVVVAKIVAVSKPPVPRAQPYADALTTTKYNVIEVEAGGPAAGELLAVEPVMKAFELLPAAKHGVGDVHRLLLVPWQEKVAADPAVEKVRLLDDVLDYEPDMFWVEERGAAP